MAAATRYSAITVLILVFSVGITNGQRKFDAFLTPSDSFNPQRFNHTVAVESVVTTSILTGLYFLWYADYPQSSFHFVNDNRDWLQMDKLGHGMTAYYVGVSGINLMKWTGMKREKAIWYGGLQGWLFLMAVEIFDGFSAEW
jgi:hypothetical protein